VHERSGTADPRDPDPPDPAAARSAAEYVALLNALRLWAGNPSLRRLRQLAGRTTSPAGDTIDALPPTTTSRLLGGGGLPRLPRVEFVRAYVTACLRFCDHPPGLIEQQVAAWLAAWRRLATPGPAGSSYPPADESHGAAAAEGHRTPAPAGRLGFLRDRRVAAVALVLVAAGMVALSVGAGALNGKPDARGSGGPREAAANGPVRLRTGPVPAQPPEPLAWWRFEEGGGTTARDSTGNGHDATISGSVRWEAAGGGGAGGSTAGAGKALVLGGEAHATTRGPVFRSDRAFTVTAWVRLDPGAVDKWGTVVSLHDGTYDALVLNYKPESRRVCVMTPDKVTGNVVDDVTSERPLPPGQWRHLAAVRDLAAGELNLFVDGRLVGGADRARIRRAAGPLDIGLSVAKDEPMDQWRGAIDDVRIFDLPLTPAQIQSVRSHRR
jgi:hypothetical protein